MRIILAFITLILCFIGIDANARGSSRGCFQNETNRMYYDRISPNYQHQNGNSYEAYNPSAYYELYPGKCPGYTFDNSVDPNTICYVGNNRGAIRNYELVDCNLDSNAWMLIIPMGLLGFAFVRKKSKASLL
ncbi:hypothetical protein [Pedobacter sp. Hv1]|uniref:hypothetical protein n=1 Tax=Pedobacter sp. Hv1 TaxID=1740090 RepID=UPI0006D8B2CC|nr:hypothetical protein [Pedobacter sp. Hv1]KQC01456.1 hypothetical protein AQF98_07045 [Pedobacter sp. Hv1]